MPAAIPRRVRQRLALGISDEEMAAELRITTEELVVVEVQADSLPRTEDIGRTWDLALGRIVKARQDATQDEAADTGRDTSDALRLWGTGPERAHSAPTRATVPPSEAEPAPQPSGATSRRKRPE